MCTLRVLLRYVLFWFANIIKYNISLYRHYSVPYVPEISDFNNFEGILMHSHDYREPEKFRNLKVVVLGAGASGIDIAIEVSTVAKEVSLYKCM